MKLNLLILLLIGVVSATQNLSGSEAAQDPVRIEDATEKEAPSLRALRPRRQCYENIDCGDSCWKCNRDKECVYRNKCRVKYGEDYYYYYGYEGLNRDIGKRCDRNRQCRGDLLRCNKNRGRCELKPEFESGRKRLFKYCKHNSQCGDSDSDLKCNKSLEMCVPRSGYSNHYFDRASRKFVLSRSLSLLSYNSFNGSLLSTPSIYRPILQQ